MTIAEYQSILKHPLRPRTVTFLIDNDRILLGLKKRGFGKGNLLGIGGKVDEDEDIATAARREVREEVGVEVTSLEDCGMLNFYFPHVADESWNQQVHVFIARRWDGQPHETEEILPEWFATSEVPYARMWDDARYWLPLVLDGKKVAADFTFDENLKVVDVAVHEVAS